MKKIIISIFLLLCLTGCSSEINYNFNDNGVTSTIKSSFTGQEYYNYMKSVDPDINDYDSNKIDQNISNFKSSIIIPAIKNRNVNYNEDSFTKSDKYNATYSYNFSYSDFKENYILDKCFDYFISYEDENFYYYEANGNYNCDIPNLKINVTSTKGISNNNADSIDNGIYTWNIKEKDNDISFSINKKVVEEGEIITPFMEICYIVVGILIFITAIMYLLLPKKRKWYLN